MSPGVDSDGFGGLAEQGMGSAGQPAQRQEDLMYLKREDYKASQGPAGKDFAFSLIL